MFENHTKMEGTFNGTLQEDTHKVEDSLTEDKEVVLQAPAEDNDVDIAITDEHVETEVEDVSESVVDSLDPSLNVSSVALHTVELELKEEKGEDLLSLEDQVCVQSGLHVVTQSTGLGLSDVATAPNSSLEDTDEISAVVANHEVEENDLSPSADNDELSSASGNEGLRETEVVETVKDMTVAEEEKVAEVVLSSTDVVSREVVETRDEKSDESGKVSLTGVEKSMVISTYEKAGEQLDVQESSSYESAKESFQTSSYVPDDESNDATQQGKTEEPRSFENPVGNLTFVIISYGYLSLLLVLEFKMSVFVVLNNRRSNNRVCVLMELCFSCGDVKNHDVAA